MARKIQTKRPRFVTFLIAVSLGLTQLSFADSVFVFVFIVMKMDLDNGLLAWWTISVAMAVLYAVMSFGFIRQKAWARNLAISVGVLNMIRYTVIVMVQFSSISVGALYDNADQVTGARLSSFVNFFIVWGAGYWFINRLRKMDIMEYLADGSSTDDLSKVFE